MTHFSLRARRLLPLLVLFTVTASAPALTACNDDPTQPGCCRVCTTGKACGDTCIPRDWTCSAPPGCACNDDGGY